MSIVIAVVIALAIGLLIGFKVGTLWNIEPQHDEWVPK
jgi:hypothetical protein